MPFPTVPLKARHDSRNESTSSDGNSADCNTSKLGRRTGLQIYNGVTKLDPCDFVLFWTRRNREQSSDSIQRSSVKNLDFLNRCGFNGTSCFGVWWTPIGVMRQGCIVKHSSSDSQESLILAFSDPLRCDPSVRCDGTQSYSVSNCCSKATPHRGWSTGFGSLVATFMSATSPHICGLPNPHGGLPVSRLRLLPG